MESDNENNIEVKKSSLFLKRKKIIIPSFILLIVFVIVGLLYSNGILMSDDSKLKKIDKALIEKNYDKATKLTNKYFKENTYDLLRKDELNMINSYKSFNVGTKEDYNAKLTELALIEQKAKEEKEEKTNINLVEITKQDNKIDGNYIYSYTTIKNNNSKALKYIKINIYCYNEQNEDSIVGSYWTNSSSTLPSGGSMTLDKMIPYQNNYKYLKSEVAEVRFD